MYDIFEGCEVFDPSSRHHRGEKVGTADDLYEAERKVKEIRHRGRGAWAVDRTTGEEFDPATMLRKRTSMGARQKDLCPQCGEDMNHPSQHGRHEPRLKEHGGCRLRKKNPSPRRRGGVQTHEDYAKFGPIYTTKYEDKDADQIHFSHLDLLGAKDLIQSDDVLVPQYLGGSDYSGGSLTKANYDSFMEEFSEVPGVIAIYGSHGSYAVGIRIHAINEEMVELFEKLQDYPIIDEQKMSEVESEWEGEAWENWARSDFLRALRTKFPQLEDHIDALDEDRDEQHDAVLTLFEEAREASNTYWTSEHSGMYIDIARVVNEVEEDDIPEPE